MPDSNPTSSPDARKPRPDNGFVDDDSIDLGGLEPVEEGATALSFSGRSGTRTAGSSGVRTWEQLVQDAASESGVLPARAPSADEIELAQDSDLLREVLAGDKPPSKIVLKDPTHGETAAYRPEDEPKSGKFDLPPELATRAGDSSILTPPSAVGLGSAASDVWASSSRVDLLGPDKPNGVDSGSLQQTEKMHSRAGLRAHDNSSVLVSGPDGGIESSTVDLTSPSDDAPRFVESGAGAPAVARRRPVIRPAATRPTHRPTLLAGVTGLLIGGLVCTVLWWTGVVSNETARTPVVKADLGDWPARIRAAEQARDEAARKAAVASAESDKLRLEAKQAALATAESRRAQDKVRGLAEQVKRAEAAGAALKGQVEQLTATRATSEAQVREAGASLAELRQRLNHAEADARTARQRADETESARKQSAEFAAEIAHRLKSSSGAPASVLAALDRALARSEESSAIASDRSAAAPAGIKTPEQAAQTVYAGLAAYRSGQFAAAEHEFAQLAASSQADAVSFYCLGLAQWRQGRLGDAEDSFRRGWEFERSSRPSPAEVEAAFERWDRAEREVVNRFRR
jgi:hypothetical protein